MVVRPHHLYFAYQKLKAERSGQLVRALPRVGAKRNASSYAFEPEAYIREVLGWEPWRGLDRDRPGQVEVIEAYTLALRQLFERMRYQLGEITAEECEYWTPGEVIKNWIRIEAGHTVGKTKLAAGLVNHFYDSFLPCVGYTFAPTKAQVHDLLWKEIKADRQAAVGLPGRIMDLELRRSHNHFVQGRATDNSEGKGTERIQGQHERHQIYVLDEAEGIAAFVWNTIDTLTSGGISIVLLLGNPRTRVSNFYRAGFRLDCQSFRVSCLNHPNVIQGAPIIPGAVSREYVNTFLRDHCDVVPEHDPDNLTFTVAWAVPLKDGGEYPPGTIFLPDSECLFRVLGIAPANITDKTIIPVGRYESAVIREPMGQYPNIARIGVDVARWGRDAGTIYCRWDGRVWREARITQSDYMAYKRRIVALCERLYKAGVRSIHIRVDGGGGFGGGVIDLLVHDLPFNQMMQADGGDFEVWEVHFNGTPYDPLSYHDLATEMYYDAAAALLRLKVVNPPAELERDLTEREFRWWNDGGVDVKRIEAKDEFRTRMYKAGRGIFSPDDGDGFGLAVGSDHVFERSRESVVQLLDDQPAGVRISDV